MKDNKQMKNVNKQIKCKEAVLNKEFDFSDQKCSFVTVCIVLCSTFVFLSLFKGFTSTLIIFVDNSPQEAAADPKLNRPYKETLKVMN